MQLTKILTPAAVLATIALAAPVAHADQRGGGQSRGQAVSRGGGQSRGQAVSRGASRPTGPRMAGPSIAAPRMAGPRSTPMAARTTGGARTFAGPRTFAGSRGVAQARGIGVAQRGRGVVRVPPRGVGPRGGFAPNRFYRPYYHFRPRVSLGFGLWLGYPVAYPYYYYDGYPYGYGYPAPYYPYSAYGYQAPAYGYPPAGYAQSGYPAPPQAQGSVGVQPDNGSGGVSFEITPSDAGVYVDGTYVGTVERFSPTSPPLALTPGRHHIEVRSPGYQAIVIDTDVTAGEVIPYQGAMVRQD